MAKSKRNIKSADNGNTYENFLKDLSIIELRLVSSSSRFDAAADAKIRSSKTPEPVRRLLKADYRLGDVGNDFFDALVKFEFMIEGKKTKAKPVLIECCFEGHFHNKSPIDKKMADRFTELDFRLIVWPYLREFVHDVTSRMSIPPVVIPFSTQTNFAPTNE
jgi:preprotein translocase subunit SecB